MAFRKISYLIPACDGCGLAWSFMDLACSEGIPPHFASRAAGLARLPADYGWDITRRRLARPLMRCRACAVAGVVPAGWWRVRARALGCRARALAVCRLAARQRSGLGQGHPESMTAGLPAAQEEWLAAVDAEVFPEEAA